MSDTITLPREVVERLVATWDWDAETLIGHRMKIMSELVDNLRTALAAEQPPPDDPLKDAVQWVVNDSAELGVKTGNRFFWLYKGESLVYENATHDDGTPMMWRPVGKYEFGECCHPVKFNRPGVLLPERYTDELVYIPGLSVGNPADYEWRLLPMQEDK